MRRISAICIPFAFILLACSGDGVLDSGTEVSSDIAAKRGGQPKVDICHWDAEEEVYALIRVAAPAESAHLAHGDEVAGGDALDEMCEPVCSPGRASNEEITRPLLPTGGETMTFVWIEPGCFTMGSPPSEVGRYDREGPQHEVTISQGFYLGKYEITQRQWQAVMGTTPWLGENHVQANPAHPAVYVSWEDMQQLVRRLNEDKAGLYRLPTEAEWEYACRAGTTTPWSFEDQLGEYAWYEGNAWNAGLQYAQPVGMKWANPWGLHDMHGNVYEWVQDWYDGEYYSSDSQRDPQGPLTGSTHVERGGNFVTITDRLRSADRNEAPPGFIARGLGARLLRTH